MKRMRLVGGGSCRPRARARRRARAARRRRAGAARPGRVTRTEAVGPLAARRAARAALGRDGLGDHLVHELARLVRRDTLSPQPVSRKTRVSGDLRLDALGDLPARRLRHAEIGDDHVVGGGIEQRRSPPRRWSRSSPHGPPARSMSDSTATSRWSSSTRSTRAADRGSDASTGVRRWRDDLEAARVQPHAAPSCPCPRRSRR